MSKNRKQDALVPRLRFPEFRDESGWSPVRLNQLAARVTTKNTDGSVTRVLTNSAEHGVLNQREYFDKDIATKGNLDGYYVVQYGDFVYNPRVSAAAPVGPISRNNVDPGVMSPLYTVFRFYHTDTEFHEHYFKSTSWHSYLRSVSSTGARHDRMSITTADFMQMPVPNPHPDEQQKIVDCLGSMDDLVAAEEQRLTALQDHKKGLIQQLFPRGNETCPRLRFPEFRDTDWKEESLKSFADYQNGKAYEKDICEDGRFIVVNSRFVSTDGAIRKFTNKDYCTACRGDVLMVLSDLPKGRALAKCFLVNKNNRFAVNQRVARLTPKSIEAEFMYHLLNRNPRLLEFDDGITQTHLSKRNVRDCLFKLPQTPAEQRRIADCLSTIDALIVAQADKLEALRTHKRGLMQQLFPSSEDA